MQIEFDPYKGSGKVEKKIAELKPNVREKWLEYAATLEDSTKRVYQSAIIDFLHEFRTREMVNIYPVDCERYIESLHRKELKLATISFRVSAIKSFFKYLIDTGVKSSSPFDKIDTVYKTEPTGKRHILSWDQILKLKSMNDENVKKVFQSAYYEQLKVTQVGLSEYEINKSLSKMGFEIKIQELNYSDIRMSRRKYFAICPVTNQEIEMTKENWMFKNGLLQSREEK